MCCVEHELFMVSQVFSAEKLSFLEDMQFRKSASIPPDRVRPRRRKAQYAQKDDCEANSFQYPL
jgi:hypothetical protein